MKKTVIILILAVSLMLFTKVSAEEITPEEIYHEQYSAGNVDKISDSLPKEIVEKLEVLELDNSSIDGVKQLSVKNIFTEIFTFFKMGCKTPFFSAVSVLAILLFSSSIGGLTRENKTISYAVTVGITASVVIPALSTLLSCVSAIKSAGIFMTAFIPIFAAMLLSRGKPITATGYSSIMLCVAEGVSSVTSFIVVPLMSMQLSLSICSCVMDEINISSFCRAIKKASSWILSFISTILLGLLGIQTIVSVPADNLTTKTAKFVISSSLPVVGNTVSEAFSTILGSVKLLGSKTVVYGILALCLLLIPVIIEIIIWRVSLCLCASAAEILLQTRTADVIRSVDTAFAFVLGVMVLILIIFIISITMVSVV